MRAGEIFRLTWDKVDIANRMIKLAAADTKTSEPRMIYLCDKALAILAEAGIVRSPRYSPTADDQSRVYGPHS